MSSIRTPSLRTLSFLSSAVYPLLSRFLDRSISASRIYPPSVGTITLDRPCSASRISQPSGGSTALGRLLSASRTISLQVSAGSPLHLTAPLRFQFSFISALASALKRLPAIRRRRQQEKLRARRTDREVFALFDGLSRRPDIRVYD